MASDLSSVPLIALSAETKEYIANLLNPTKFLSNENGCRRDWRGLTRLLEVNAELMPWLECQENPTNFILDRLGKSKRDTTMNDFQLTMEQMDRWDIIDDTQEMFENDAVKYLERQQRAEVSADPIDDKVDREILTFDDAYRLGHGLSTAYYDAFLLYAEEDAGFAKEIMKTLQTEYKLNLCYNEDLVAGQLFEHEAVMKLISERCNRLLVILSPNFIGHPVNEFYLSYTQALSIEKRQRKIVPCLYKNCPDMPYALRFLSCVRYTEGKYESFLARLSCSIKAPIINSNTSSMGCSNMIPELVKIENTLPDSDIIQTVKKTDEEMSRHSLQSENDILPDVDCKASNVDKKKDKKFLHKKIKIKKWKNGIKKLNKKNSVKSEQNGQSQSQLITTETILNLPSPPSHDLSSLSLSSISLNPSNFDMCKEEKITKKSSSDKKKGSPIFFRKKKISLLAS